MTRVRYAYLAAGFVLLLLFGVINSWSVFIGPLEAEFGWERAQTSSVFTVTMVSFCAGNLAAGALAPRASTRARLGAAALLSAAGFAAASFTSSLALVYLFYGVLGGFAVGMGTNSVMSSVLLWFPDRQGAASGALLMGVGLGSLLLGPAVTALLGAFGWRAAFRALGLAFGCLLAAGALLLREPGPCAAKRLAKRSRASLRKDGDAARRAEGPGRGPRLVLRTPSFWAFFAWAALIGAGGMAVVSNAVPAAQDVLVAGGLDAESAVVPATLAMGAVSACNGLARPVAGWAWDAMGERVPLFAVPAVYALAMVLCAIGAATALFPVLAAGFLLAGMAHGASQSVTSALVRSFFGVEDYSANYALAQCNLMAAALAGPPLAGLVRGAAGSYLGCYLVLAAFAAAAFAAARFVRRPS